MKKDPNFEEKLTFYLKNDMRSLVKFNLSSGKWISTQVVESNVR